MCDTIRDLRLLTLIIFCMRSIRLVLNNRGNIIRKAKNILAYFPGS